MAGGTQQVLDAFVVKDRDTGESRGFGFVIFETERSMNDAIDAMDGQDLGGRTIRVNPAGDLSASAPRSAGGGNGGRHRCADGELSGRAHGFQNDGGRWQTGCLRRRYWCE